MPINRSHLYLSIIILTALFLRLHNLNTPLADWHSWRQADTASVTREYVKHGIDIFHPQYHDVSNLQSGKHNPQGYRMVEFPIINAISAFAFQASEPLHNLEIHIFLRIISIIFSLGSIYLIYLIGRVVYSESIGLLSATMMAVLPFNIFYSRTVLPEIPLIFFSLLTMYLSLYYIELTDKTKNKSPIISKLKQSSPERSEGSSVWKARRPHILLIAITISASISLLLKPIAGFYFLPILVLAWHQRGFKWIFQIKHLITLTFIIAPLIAWRWWISHFPEGIPAFDWLLNHDNIRFSGAFFYWLFADRIGRLILGYWGLALLGAGIIHSDSDSKQSESSKLSMFSLRTKAESIFALSKKSFSSHANNEQSKSAIFTYSWIVSMLAYLFILAGGNVRHDYYQIALIPLISILLALGIKSLWKKTITSRILTLVSLSFMLAFSWYHIRGYYSVHNWAMVEAGIVIDQITPPDALVIAPYHGDTAFLYQTNRRGWPIGHNIEDKIKKGAQYYVTTNIDDEARELMQTHQIIHQTEKYVIIRLNNIDELQ